MSVQQIKREFRDILKSYSTIDADELKRIFAESVLEFEFEKGWDENSKSDSWTDDELRIILSDAPTKENCLKHAKGFKRGYGAIEQIYRWAAATDKRIKSERPKDAFVARVKRVAKQLGWRA